MKEEKENFIKVIDTIKHRGKYDVEYTSSNGIKDLISVAVDTIEEIPYLVLTLRVLKNTMKAKGDTEIRVVKMKLTTKKGRRLTDKEIVGDLPRIIHDNIVEQRDYEMKLINRNKYYTKLLKEWNQIDSNHDLKKIMIIKDALDYEITSFRPITRIKNVDLNTTTISDSKVINVILDNGRTITLQQYDIIGRQKDIIGIVEEFKNKLI